MHSRADVSERANELLQVAVNDRVYHFVWDPKRAINNLSPREVQVIFGVAYGFTEREIGSRLGIAPDTVKSHMRRIFRKTRTNSRAELVSWGYRWGLLQRLPIQVEPKNPIYLSHREREMAYWVVQGLTNKEISSTVFLTVDTVKSHLRTLFKKIGARDRGHVVTLAWQYNLIPRECWEEENGAGKK